MDDEDLTQRRQSPASDSLLSGWAAHVWAACAGLLVVGLMALTWDVVNRQERALIGRTTTAKAQNLQNLIRQDLNRRTTVLVGLARRWNSDRAAHRVRWTADATNIHTAHPGFRRVVWIDRAMHVRWVVPIVDNHAAVDANIRSLPDSFLIFERARETRAPVVSAPLKLIEGDAGMAIMVPVNTNDQFDGVITGVLQFDSWFAALLQVALTPDYEMAIFLDNQNVFGRNDFTSAVDQDWAREVMFEFGNHSWRIAAAPSAAYLALVHSRFSSIMILATIMLGLMVYVAVFVSMKSRGRARQLLSTSRRLKGLLKNIPGMLCSRGTGEPWPIVYCSEGSKSLCGYDPKALEQSMRWEALVHPDDVGNLNKALHESVSNRRPYDAEYRIRTRSGSERWVWERGSIIGDEFDKNSTIKGFVTDITARKLAEFKLKEAQSFSEAIVDAAIEAVITIGADGRILNFNREAEEIFGYTAEEVVGRDFKMMLPGKYHEEHREYLQYFNETDMLKYSFRRREMQLLRKYGTEFPAQVSVHDMQHQKVPQFVVIVRDVSAEQAAEEEARDHLENLAHAGRLNMLGEMASGIAHEVNQPLTAISLFAQAGKRLFEAGKQPQLPDVFDKLSQHAQRAGAVIERMQRMARQQESHMETVACASLIRGVATLAEAEARIRDIEIDVELDENLPPVSVDSVQIQQVVLNLLRNGMEAMRSNGCQHGNTIELSARLAGSDTIEIAVKDSGGGISNEVAKELFTPFSTTKESGMGMGLAISQSIVSAHNGHISFENNSIGGATFSFSLFAAKQGKNDE